MQPIRTEFETRIPFGRALDAWRTSADVNMTSTLDSAQDQPQIPGGFAPVPTSQLLLSWFAYQHKHIKMLDLRLFYALLEQQQRAQFDESAPFAFFRLQQLTGAPRRKIQAALRNLLRVGLVIEWSPEKTILAHSPDSLDISDPSPYHAMLAQIHVKNRQRSLPIPRRLIRYLARCGNRCEFATILGHSLRSLFLDDECKVNDTGSCSETWISKLFGVGVASVRRIRKKLLAEGWLTRLSAESWHIRAYGTKYKLNLDWNPELPETDFPLLPKHPEPTPKNTDPPIGPSFERSSNPTDPNPKPGPDLSGDQGPPPPDPGPPFERSPDPHLSGDRTPISTETGPPFERSPDPHLSGAYKTTPSKTKTLETKTNQPTPAKTTSAGWDGVCGEESCEDKQAAVPRLDRIRREDLLDTGCLLVLFLQAVKQNEIAESENALLNFVAAAERALRVADSPCGMFRSLLAKQQVHFASAYDADRARQRLTALYRRGHKTHRDQQPTSINLRQLQDLPSFIRQQISPPKPTHKPVPPKPKQIPASRPQQAAPENKPASKNKPATDCLSLLSPEQRKLIWPKAWEQADPIDRRMFKRFQSNEFRQVCEERILSSFLDASRSPTS